MKNTILLNQLKNWEDYPVQQVQSGIKIYLDKKCADEGKNEKYLLGIIRKQKSDPNKKLPDLTTEARCVPSADDTIKYLERHDL